MLAVAVAVAVAGACGSDEPTVQAAPDFAACGFPTPDPAADPGEVPTPLLLGGEATVAQTEVKDGRLIAALHVPHSVNEAFGLYKSALADAELDVLQEDNEGFEAELYLKTGKELGSLQIRSSKCDDAVIVYLNLPAG